MEAKMDPAQVVELEIIARQDAMNSVIDRFSSPVQQFYCGATVFVTGGSGFLGKQLVEKLFRSCKIKKIFVLMRSKKGKTVEDRMKAILEDPVYDGLRKKQPDFATKIVAIEGNVADLSLGLSNKDRETLVKEVSIIFHMAATVRFNEPLRVATLINVRGTREIVQLAKECTNLKCLNYVSTAFAHATNTRIGSDVAEQFYHIPVPPEAMISLAENLDDETFNRITPGLVSEWPNTYTFTKAIAEEVIRTTAADLPVCVVKPPFATVPFTPEYSNVCTLLLDGIITYSSVVPILSGPAQGILFIVLAGKTFNAAAYEREDLDSSMGSVPVTGSYIEPTPGWVDESALSGPMGILLGIGLGVIHLIYGQLNKVLSYAPLDYVNNAIIGASWDSCRRRESGETDISLYTISALKYGVNWKFFGDCLRSDEFVRLVTPRAVWYCGAVETENKYIYWVLTWLFHYIPAYIFDAVCTVIRKRPEGLPFPSFVQLYTRLYKVSMAYSYFVMNEWNFKDDNLRAMIQQFSVEDRVIFNCDLSTIDYKELLKALCIGLRRFIVKDNLQDSVVAYRRQFILKYVNILFLTVYFYFIWKILYFIYGIFVMVFSY